MVDVNGHITTSVYDRTNRLTAIINANGYATTFVYDNSNRKINEIDADGGVRTMAYDPVGNVTQSLDPRGAGVSNGFDFSNRLTAQLFTDGQTRSFVYDNVGNRVGSYSSIVGTYNSTYDARNQLTQLEEPGTKTVNYSYDAANRRTQMAAYGEGNFNYAYDKANRQTFVQTPASKISTLAYDPLARVTHQTYANGAVTSQTFDAAGNLSQITQYNDGGLAQIAQFTYAYNKANQRTLQTEADGTVTAWTYDGKYQLTNETQTGGPAGLAWSTLTVPQWANLTVNEWATLPVDPSSTEVNYSLTHTYDPAGNRTQLNDGGAVTTFTYTPANRLTLANAQGTITTYTNDTAGNRTAMATPMGSSTYTTYYSWDATGAMTVAEPSTGTVTFTYNSEGQRFLKDSNGEVTKFLYDYKKLLAETDNAGDVTSLFTTTTDQEYGDLIDEDGGAATHLYDAQANTNALLDSTGAVLANYKYFAFGNISAYSVDGAPYTQLDTNQWQNLNGDGWSDLTPSEGSITMLAGGKKQYYLDQETTFYILGMGNNGERPVDPSTVRFGAEDPIRQNSGEVNPYPYVQSNPVNNLDPSGHMTEQESEQMNKEQAAKWKEMQSDRPGEMTIHHHSEWVASVGGPPMELRPKKGDERLITFPNGVSYVGEIKNEPTYDTDTAYARWAWGGDPTTVNFDYDEVFTRVGSDYSEQLISEYQDSIKQYAQAVRGVAEVGQQIVDAAGSLNPLVNIVTLFSGESASGQKVSTSDRVTAGASILPTEAVIAAVVAFASVYRKARALRIMRIVTLMHAVEIATDKAERLKLGQAISKLATDDELASEAKRIFNAAYDTRTKQLDGNVLTNAMRDFAKLGGAAKSAVRDAEEGGASAKAVHDLYVQKVRPGAKEVTFETPWSEGKGLGSRRFDDFDPKTGTAFEGNTTPWGSMTQDQLSRKLDQAGSDFTLLKTNPIIKRIVWFGTEDLPTTGLGAQLKEALRKSGIEYKVVKQ